MTAVIEGVIEADTSKSASRRGIAVKKHGAHTQDTTHTHTRTLLHGRKGNLLYAKNDYNLYEESFFLCSTHAKKAGIFLCCASCVLPAFFDMKYVTCDFMFFGLHGKPRSLFPCDGQLHNLVSPHQSLLSVTLSIKSILLYAFPFSKKKNTKVLRKYRSKIREWFSS